jgi:Fe-S cluster assembly iron-binding protein IscA
VILSAFLDFFLISVSEDGTTETQYYVHYEERDRRNDEWIEKAKILEFVPPLTTPTFNKPRLSTDSLPLTR